MGEPVRRAGDERVERVARVETVGTTRSEGVRFLRGLVFAEAGVGRLGHGGLGFDARPLGAHLDGEVDIDLTQLQQRVAYERKVSTLDALLHVGVGNRQEEARTVTDKRVRILERGEPHGFGYLRSQQLRCRRPQVFGVVHQPLHPFSPGQRPQIRPQAVDKRSSPVHMEPSPRLCDASTFVAGAVPGSRRRPAHRSGLPVRPGRPCRIGREPVRWWAVTARGSSERSLRSRCRSWCSPGEAPGVPLWDADTSTRIEEA